jgi:hypothetical protein
VRPGDRLEIVGAVGGERPRSFVRARTILCAVDFPQKARRRFRSLRENAKTARNRGEIRVMNAPENARRSPTCSPSAGTYRRDCSSAPAVSRLHADARCNRRTGDRTVAIRRTNIGQNAGEASLLDALPPAEFTYLPNSALPRLTTPCAR